jgi:hypothetical protein
MNRREFFRLSFGALVASKLKIPMASNGDKIREALKEVDLCRIESALSSAIVGPGHFMDVLPEKYLRMNFGGLAESKMKMPLHKIFPMARPTEARDGEIIGGRHRELSAI